MLAAFAHMLISKAIIT